MEDQKLAIFSKVLASESGNIFLLNIARITYDSITNFFSLFCIRFFYSFVCVCGYVGMFLCSGDNPFFSGIDAMPDIRPRKKSIPLVSELVLKVCCVCLF